MLQKLSRYSDGLQAEMAGFNSGQRQEIFLFSTASRLALGPTQHPIQWVPGALSLGVKRPGSESDHSPPSSTEFKIGGAVSPLPHMYLWRGA
jgi:hypothetical protein